MLAVGECLPLTNGWTLKKTEPSTIKSEVEASLGVLCLTLK